MSVTPDADTVWTSITWSVEDEALGECRNTEDYGCSRNGDAMEYPTGKQKTSGILSYSATMSVITHPHLSEISCVGSVAVLAGEYAKALLMWYFSIKYMVILLKPLGMFWAKLTYFYILT